VASAGCNPDGGTSGVLNLDAGRGFHLMVSVTTQVRGQPHRGISDAAQRSVSPARAQTGN